MTANLLRVSTEFCRYAHDKARVKFVVEGDHFVTTKEKLYETLVGALIGPRRSSRLFMAMQISPKFCGRRIPSPGIKGWTVWG